MNDELLGWLDELERDGVFLSDEPGAGAIENKWSLSLPVEMQIEAEVLIDFLERAVKIRNAHAAAQHVRPVTFYAWHDEMAGQLRFSTAHCTPRDLPFGGPAIAVERPDAIVKAFLDSSNRDGIVSWNELTEAAPGNGEEENDDVEALPFPVWTVELVS